MIYDKISSRLQDITKTTVQGLRGSSPAHLAAAIAANQPCCCIVPDEHLIQGFENDLRLFTDQEILIYPGQEIPPYTPLSPDQQITAQRLSALYRLREGEAPIVITSIEALLRRIMPSQVLADTAEYIEAGEDCDQDDLIEKLDLLGYEKVSLVQSIGDFSLRGGIFDIFPPPFVMENGVVHEGPVRLDYFGDTIDSLRSFDPFNQRSTGEIQQATFLPVTDILLSRNRPQQRKIARTFEELGETLGWRSEETARLMERSNSGMRFAGMEFFLPLYYQNEKTSSSAALDFLPQKVCSFYWTPKAFVRVCISLLRELRLIMRPPAQMERQL